MSVTPFLPTFHRGARLRALSDKQAQDEPDDKLRRAQMNPHASYDWHHEGV